MFAKKKLVDYIPSISFIPLTPAQSNVDCVNIECEELAKKKLKVVAALKCSCFNIELVGVWGTIEE